MPMRPSRLSRLLHSYRVILTLGLPILVGQVGMIVVGFADNAMVGHYSTDALASASFVNNLFNIAIMMCLGFAYGLTPLIGALFTSGHNNEIGLTLRDGVRVNLMYGVMMTTVMGILYFYLDRLGQPQHLLPLIRPYYLLYLGGIIPICLFQTFAQWAYAVNSTKMPMWIILIANLVNVCGNYILIYGNFGLPEWGLTGAGVSTLIARCLCPLMIYIIFRRMHRYKVYHKGFYSRVTVKRQCKKIFRTSMPVSLQLGFETASFSCAAIMAGWLGHVELAAFQVLFVIGTLGFCVYYSIGSALSVTVANAAGEGDSKKMQRMALAGYHVILMFALVSSMIFMFAGEILISIFTSDRQVATIASGCIGALILYQVADATQIAFSNALRGTSDVMPMLLTAFISYIVIGLPVTYLLTFVFDGGLTGMFLSFSVSLAIAALLYLYYFRAPSSA